MIISTLSMLLQAVSVPAFGFGPAVISDVMGVYNPQIDVLDREEYTKYNAIIYEISHDKYTSEDLDDGVTLFKIPSISAEVFVTGQYSQVTDSYDINLQYQGAVSVQPINISGYIEFGYTYEEEGGDFEDTYLIPFNLMDITTRYIFKSHHNYSFRHDMGDEMNYKIVMWLNSEAEYNSYIGESSYSQGYGDGYIQGYNEGDAEGSADGYTRGYDVGYNVGFDTGAASTHEYTFLNLFSAIADTPVLMIRSLFDFDFFGVNLLTVVLSLFTGLILFYLLRKLL